MRFFYVGTVVQKMKELVKTHQHPSVATYTQHMRSVCYKPLTQHSGVVRFP